MQYACFFLPAKRKRKTQEDSVSKDFFFYKKNGESLALCVPLPFMCAAPWGLSSSADYYY
jgi:hypothetical protein